MARDIVRVVSYVLEITPKTETCLLTELLNLRRGFAYCPPELMPREWLKLECVLSANLGDPDTEWKQLIADIVTDRKKVPENFKHDV